MRSFGKVLYTAALIAIIVQAVNMCLLPYRWNRDFLSHWTLADKSSTIEAKSDHVDRFVEAIKDREDEFAPHSAVFLTSMDNSFAANLEALTTLADRLRQTKTMDPSSFAYQTAIQQITAQEQGGANDMLRELRDCWIKGAHPLLWNWWSVLVFATYIILAICGFLFWQLN